MKSAKIFIIFTIVLAFVLQVSAQDEKPKIVWKNLQEKYGKFEDIKPIIKNLSDKPIYLFDSYYSIKLIVYMEDKKDWITLYPFICGTDLNIKPYKIPTQNDFELIIRKSFWDLNTDDPVGLNSIKSYKNKEIGKFRLKLTFGLKKSALYSETSISPEFQVKIPKS